MRNTVGRWYVSGDPPPKSSAFRRRILALDRRTPNAPPGGLEIAATHGTLSMKLAAQIIEVFVNI